MLTCSAITVTFLKSYPAQMLSLNPAMYEIHLYLNPAMYEIKFCCSVSVESEGSQLLELVLMMYYNFVELGQVFFFTIDVVSEDISRNLSRQVWQ